MGPKKSDHSNSRRPPSQRRVDRLDRRVDGWTYPPLVIGVIGHSTGTKRENNEGRSRVENVQEVTAPAWRAQTLLTLEEPTGPALDQTTRTIRPTSQRKTGTFAQARPQSSTDLEDQ